MDNQSVFNIEGEMPLSDLESGLIQRCRHYWSVPVCQFPNGIVAMFIRQRIGLAAMLPEAHNRLRSGYDDESELYEGELSAAVDEAPKAQLGIQPDVPASGRSAG